MPDYVIDFARLRFWIFLPPAILALVSLTDAQLRRWIWAGANLAFLGLLLSPDRLLVVLAAVVIVHAVLKLVEGTAGTRLAAMALLGGGTLGLFVIHRLPWVITGSASQGWHPILVAVGFAYVALRILDVLRAVAERRHPAPDLPSTINYLLPFHMLAAGPIQSYDDFVAQPAVPPAPGRIEVLDATERIARGLVKKFVLAYILQKLFLTGFRAHGPYFLFEANIFFIWLYLDFSALSDLAVGMGRLLGVATPENFNRPYVARNIVDFWERWHISLSQFIRRNLFFPIQVWLMRRTDGRHPLWCASIAFTACFALCGLWHEFRFPYLAWGLLHAGALVINNLYRYALTRTLGTRGVKAYLADPRIRAVATVVTFEFVAFAAVVADYPWKELWR